ncbi:MAG: cytochrome P450, partial [Microbacteriaceae bacterium]|nr:cytochrome P450 [Microbacteriaceae bacterium]
MSFLFRSEPEVGLARMRWYEERVHRAAHPLVYPLLCRVPGPVKRIPGLGVIVRDTALMREVLLDLEHFSKCGPGASSDIWTPILGPSLLLNMTGEEHMRLRRKLQPLFSRRAVDELVASDIGPVLEPVKAALRAGQAVDLVAVTRRSSSRFIANLAGLESDFLSDELFSRINAITRMVKLSRPRFPEKAVKKAREILREVMDAAVAQYRAGSEATVPGRMRVLGLSEEEAVGAVGAFMV